MLDTLATTREGRDALRFEIHTNWDEPWGSCLQNLFGVCDVLYLNGSSVPAEIGYSPGGGGPAVEEYPTAMFLEFLDDGSATVADFEYWARVLARYSEIVPEALKY